MAVYELAQAVAQRVHDDRAVRAARRAAAPLAALGATALCVLLAACSTLTRRAPAEHAPLPAPVPPPPAGVESIPDAVPAAPNRAAPTAIRRSTTCWAGVTSCWAPPTATWNAVWRPGTARPSMAQHLER